MALFPDQNNKKKSSFSLIILIVFLGVMVTGLAVVYKNQQALFAIQQQLTTSMQERQEPVEVQVIEKVVAQQPWADVQSKIKDTVVRIIAQTAETNILQPYRTPKQAGGFGTGFLISADGYIVTNHHVIDEAQAIWIKIPSLGKAIIDVELVGTSPERDLALLKISDEGLKQICQCMPCLPYLELGNSDSIHRSDEVLALGYPLGDMQTSIKSTSGVVSGREHIGGRYLIQIDAPINPGSSGGPAINLLGQVIGIACAGVPGAQNVGYIIPVNELKMILDDLKVTKLLRRPFLGVLFNNGSDELAQYLGNPTPAGCYVVDVYEGSPLSKAGVKAGDMIYQIDGHKVDSYGDLCVDWSEDRVSVIDYVSRLEIGQKVNIVLYRNGKRKELDIKFDFSELLPIHKIFPGYDAIDYEIFGGMLLQPLRLNHLPILINNAPSLAKYMEFENQIKPALIVTQVIPNSQVQRLELLREGAVISEINGKEVNTLEALRKELKEAVKKEFITFKTTEGVFFVLSPSKILDDEQRLASIYQYPVSTFMQELLCEHEAKKEQNKPVQ